MELAEVELAEEKPAEAQSSAEACPIVTVEDQKPKEAADA